MRTRWVRRPFPESGYFAEVPAVDAFLADIEAVCRKHGLSISHEDSQGAFIVAPIDEDDLLGLQVASVEGVEP